MYSRGNTVRFKPNLLTAYLGAVLFAFCGGLAPPAVADDFENPVPANPPGEPATPPWNEQTFSFGVFRLQLDTNNPPWLNLLAGYPGYNAVQNTLTSPKLFDPATIIGRSKAFKHGSPPTQGVNVGHDATTVLFAGGLNPSFPLIPDFFKGPTAKFNTRKIYTEVRSLQLVSFGISACTNADPIYDVPPGFGGGQALVSAGSLLGLPVCPGQVQSDSASGNAANDFPAESFFDMFVQVMLPAWGAWPMALLTNGEPLVVENTNVINLPPTVVYLHGLTAAVPVYFANSSTNPDGSTNWNAGERFGWLILAGHGVQFDCSTATNVLHATFGQNNTNNGMAVARDDFYGRPLCPPPLSAYVSTVNALTNAFPLPSGTHRIRRIVHTNLFNPIALPAPGATNYYVATNSLVLFEVSPDNGLNWYAESAPATNTVVRIVGATNTSSTLRFDTEMLSLNVSGGTLPPGVLIREDSGKPSRGQTTARAANGGYRISSFFDVWLQMSEDNGTTWYGADNPATVGLILPTSYSVTLAAGGNTTFIANHLTISNNNINYVLPNLPYSLNNATLEKWDNAAGTWGDPETYHYGYGWEPGTTTLGPGEVAAIQNPGTVPVTIGFSGVMKEPYALPRALEHGQTYGYSMLTPSEGTYQAIAGRSPGQGAQLLKWNRVRQDYDTYIYNSGLWSPSNPVVSIGEGVFVVGPSAAQPCVVITCPSNIVVTSLDGQGVRVLYSVTASNSCGTGPVTVTCNPPSPGPIGGFQVGTNTVCATATVGSYSANCCFKVIVVNASPLVAPTITGARISNASFSVTFTGPANQTYKVVCSPDVTKAVSNWTVLSSGTFTGSPVTCVDPATNAARFYRVTSP